MPTLDFVHRGCVVDILIVEHPTLWDITIDVTPRDGVELIEPFGTRTLKLPKTEQLNVISKALIDEIQSAIDARLVGC